MASSMMNENESVDPVLDNEVADLTDAILAGRSVKTSEAAQSLTPIVRSLQELSAPVQPDAAFRTRLIQRLNTEFDSQRRNRPTRVVSFNRYRPLLTAAAVLVLVGVVALVGGPLILKGTAGLEDAASTSAGFVFGILVGALVLVGLFFWWRERK